MIGAIRHSPAPPQPTVNPTLPIEAIASHPDFVRLADIERIVVDLRYASSGNFMGRDMYAGFDCAWLHRDAAHALAAAAAALHRDNAGQLRLLVLDALRPQRVQALMWNSLADPSLRAYLAPPERGSIHSFGMAVDVTLIDADGDELDMGTPFDDMSERSHPALESRLAREGQLSVVQIANRDRLRAAMLGAGWRGINSEWWHFDCGERERVRASYTRIT